MMNLNLNLTKDKRSRLILVAIGTLAVFVGVWQMLIVNQKKALVTVAQKMADQQAKLENGKRLLASTAQLQQHLETVTQKLKLAEGEMASGDMYSWIIQTVNKFREGYKVDVPQISREVTGEVGMFAQFPYRAVLFKLRGTAFFHDLGKFVADFENRFPYMRVQNLEMEPATSSTASAIAGTGTSPATGAPEDAEKLAFRMEVVALVNPQSR